WIPNYRYVYTRLGAIRTQRKLIKRAGPYALEERTQPFDASPTGGIWVDRQLYDATGTAYIAPHWGPLEFWVAASRPDTAYLRFTIAGPQAAAIKPAPGAVAERRGGDSVDFCVPL